MASTVKNVKNAKNVRLRSRFLLAALVVATSAPAVGARQRTPFGVEYTVEIKDAESQIFHVTAKFSNVDQRQLDLALPVWTPGWYTLEYYAKNISRFAVTDERGNRLLAPLSDAQTWSIDTAQHDRIVVEFDYKGVTIGLNQAFVGNDWAFFTGTQLFLEAKGHRDTSATVRFRLPSGWRIASALAETNDPAVYTAPTYDVLVDSPTWLGAFQSHRFEFEGKPYFVILGSHVQVSAENLAKQMEDFGSIVGAQSRIFGGLPYEKYVSFCLPGDTGDALEHMNSVVGICGKPGESAHEHFHVWNVTRIRPAEMWPYDYSRPNETPSLWVSEGVTDYYDQLSTYRAGQTTEAYFLRILGNLIGAVESNEERHYVSPRDASLATWRKYLGEPVSYYTEGAVLGALLDLSILHDTKGTRGLDDVMRALFERFYKHGKGFTARDLELTVSSLAGRDYADFFRRFVVGVDVPPYETIFAFAGVSGNSRNVTDGVLGALVDDVPDGARVTTVRTGSAAAKAGLRTGDVIIAANGQPVPKVSVSRVLDGWLSPHAGTRSVFLILRDGAELEVPVDIGVRHRIAYTVALDPSPTEEQLIVRRAWLAKK